MMDKIVYLPPDETGVRWSECGQYWHYEGVNAFGNYTSVSGPAEDPPRIPPGFQLNMRPDDYGDDESSCYPSHDSLFRRLSGRQSSTPEAIHDLTRFMLAVELEERLDWSGGYPAEVDWDTFPDLVVIADLDPAKEYRRPCLVYYDKRKLDQLTRDALDEGPIDEDGRRLRGKDRAKAIYEYFCENLSECVPDRPDTESEPNPAEGEAR